MTITASADGSALGNPGPAGWAWYIDPTCWRAGGWAHGTNNMGELTAVLNLLESTRHRADEPLTVFCDSQYVINSVTKWMPGWKKKGWKKRDGKPVLNVEIMKALDRELAGRSVTFEWVKGHAGHELNEAADERARAMATAYQRKTAPQDMPVGPGFRDEPGADGGSTGPVTPSAAGGAGDPVAVPPHGEPGSGRPAPSPSSGPSASGTADTEPDLFSELESLHPSGPGAAAHAPGAGPWPAHLAAEALERETTVVCGPPNPGAAASLHPDLLWVDARGRTGTAADFAAGAGSQAEPQEVRVTALGSDACHLSYRLEERSAVTRRSSVWVREDQHNEMGPWLLRFHQVTAED